MAKKTMIRRLAKRLPKSPEVVRAMSHDGAVRQDYTPAGIDADPAIPAPDAGYIDSTIAPDPDPEPEQASPGVTSGDPVGVALQAAVSAKSNAKQVRRTTRIWFLGANYFCLKMMRYAFLYWLPYYLKEAYHYSSAKSGYVSIAFDAPDLVGKPRPTVRVVEATTNLGSDRSWTHGEGGIPAVYRLSVDGEEHLAGALARCAPPPGTVNVVDMTLDETGRVAAVRAVALGASIPPAATKDPKADNTPAACIDKALFAAAFACTDDGESAKVRLEIAWPGKP
mgnify:CR=1 FL=1